jgi:Na+-driven multidrug efflux pump
MCPVKSLFKFSLELKMFESILKVSALLTTALLFGGMLLFAGAFAAFLFKVLPVVEARSLIRKAFPFFYIFVIAASAIASLLTSTHDTNSTLILGLIALTTVPTRQVLMPAINTASDSSDWIRFNALHGLSVVITLTHIVASAVVLVRLSS